MERKINKEVKREGDKVIVTTKDIDLLDQKKKVIGTRVTIDYYDIAAMRTIKQELESQRTKFMTQKETIQGQIEDSKKKFNLKEQNKIKDFIGLSNKAAVFNQYKKQQETLSNVSDAIGHVETELKKLNEMDLD